MATTSFARIRMMGTRPAHAPAAALRPSPRLRNPVLPFKIATPTPRITTTTTAAAAGSPGSANSMQSPSTSFPNTPWPVQKAPPKSSLDPQQAAHANALSLNIVEFIHWLAFPLGFYVCHYIFVNATKIAHFVGGDESRVFFLMLGLLCQVMGGICGIQMHMYEGWQVAPFRNVLELPPTVTAPIPPTPNQINETRVPNFNNSWLRAVAYQILFTFQTLGLALFSLGVFGFTFKMQALVWGSVFVALVWRRKPQLSEAEPRWLWRLFCERTLDGVTYPIMPLSVWLFVVFMINTGINLVAYKELFGATIVAAWPPSWLPALAPLASPWWAVVPPLVVAAGGFIEGYFAESDFNQWVHGLAVVVMLVGVAMHYPLYWHLVHA